MRAIAAVLLGVVMTLLPGMSGAAPKDEFLEQISGVWSSGNSLMVVGVAADRELVMADQSSFTILKGPASEYNAQNDYLNWRATAVGTGAPAMLWTLRRVWDKNRKSFRLGLTTNAGDQLTLGFVRELSNEDKQLINLPLQKKTAAPAAPAAPAPAPVRTAAPAPAQPKQQSEACRLAEEGITVHMLSCLNEDLDAADKKLNEVYKVTMARLSPIRKDALRKEQRQWIKDRDRKCEKAGSEHAGGTAQSLEQTSCLVETTKARIPGIEAFR